ncbi:hypothetical protein LQ772_06795 [Frateuria edaphi]|uniref:STY1053 family phage-associated protein n=1 Tax=Frateuria edaphi TaxID=2898793 RepID=UPI001E44DA15|nr:hypothetical protein [Frateuria edaphi]UGB46993.1 hypothetical protein LQ772_06795 [Frateuria edaphi]
MTTTKLVNITKAFTLTLLRGGEQVAVKIAAGVQRLEADLADHWYTKAHSAEVPAGVSQTDADAEAEEAAKAAAEAEAAEKAKREAEEAAKSGGKGKQKG